MKIIIKSLNIRSPYAGENIFFLEINIELKNVLHRNSKKEDMWLDTNKENRMIHKASSNTCNRMIHRACSNICKVLSTEETKSACYISHF